VSRGTSPEQAQLPCLKISERYLR